MQVLRFKDGQLQALEREATDLRRRMAICEAESDALRAGMQTLDSGLDEASDVRRRLEGQLLTCERELAGATDELQALRAARTTWEEVSELARHLQAENAALQAANNTLREHRHGAPTAEDIAALRASLADSEDNRCRAVTAAAEAAQEAATLRQKAAVAAEEVIILRQKAAEAAEEVTTLRQKAAEAAGVQETHLALQARELWDARDRLATQQQAEARQVGVSVGVQVPFWQPAAEDVWLIPPADMAGGACCARAREEGAQLARQLQAERDTVQQLRVQTSTAGAEEVAMLRASALALRQQLAAATTEAVTLRASLAEMQDTHDRQAVECNARGREWADALAQAKELAAAAWAEDGGSVPTLAAAAACPACAAATAQTVRLRELLAAAEARAQRGSSFLAEGERLAADLSRQLALAQAQAAAAQAEGLRLREAVTGLVAAETAGLASQLAAARAAQQAAELEAVRARPYGGQQPAVDEGAGVSGRHWGILLQTVARLLPIHRRFDGACDCVRGGIVGAAAQLITSGP